MGDNWAQYVSNTLFSLLLVCCSGRRTPCIFRQAMKCRLHGNSDLKIKTYLESSRHNSDICCTVRSVFRGHFIQMLQKCIKSKVYGAVCGVIGKYVYRSGPR